jgi:hypothetical protein
LKPVACLAALFGLLVAPPAAAQSPPREVEGTNTARDGKFVALQLFAKDSKRFIEEWRKPTPPNLTTTNTAVRNKPVFLMIIVGGCDRDEQEKCDVVGDVMITDPTGAKYGDYKNLPIYRDQAGLGVLMLSPTSLAITVEDGEVLGRYRVDITITDQRAKKSLRVFDYVTVSEASAPTTGA